MDIKATKCHKVFVISLHHIFYFTKIELRKIKRADYFSASYNKTIGMFKLHDPYDWIQKLRQVGHFYVYFITLYSLQFLEVIQGAIQKWTASPLLTFKKIYLIE
jgi:hypothetical protein